MEAAIIDHSGIAERLPNRRNMVFRNAPQHQILRYPMQSAAIRGASDPRLKRLVSHSPPQLRFYQEVPAEHITDQAIAPRPILKRHAPGRYLVSFRCNGWQALADPHCK